MLNKKVILYLILIITIVLLNNCTQEDISNNSTVVINLGSSNRNLIGEQTPYKAPASVNTIILTVTAADMDTIENTYTTTATTISLSIPAGSDRVFTLEAFDSSNNIICTGTSLPTELIAGETVNVQLTIDYI